MPVIRQKQSVLNSPVGVARIDTGASQLWQQVAQTADTIQGIAVESAARKAKIKGIDTAKAVEAERLTTINPESGEPEALTIPEGFGTIATDAYRNVVNQRFENSMDNELRLKAKELAVKHGRNPEAYGKAMSQYIESMSENAVGQYKQFVVENGTNYLASTKANLQAKAMSRARAANANAIVTSADQSADSVYAASLTGNYEQANEIGAAAIADVTNGSNSGLLKKGANQQTASKMRQNAARGAIEFTIGKAANGPQRDAIALAIRSRGNEMDGVPADLHDDIAYIVQNTDPSTINQMVQFAGVVSSPYDAVERNEIAAMEAEAKQQYTDSVISGSTDATISVQSAVNGFSSENDEDVLRAVLASNASFGNRRNQIAGQLRSELISEEQFESKVRDARNETLRPLLLEAANEGNQEALEVAINNPTEANMSGLTEKQQYFVRAISASPIFNVNDDMGFVNTELSRTEDETKAAIETQRKKYRILSDVDVAVSNATDGALTIDQISNVRANIEAAAGQGLSAIEARSERARFDRALGNGVINRFARTATSAEMTQLKSYIASNGERTAGMSDLVVETGDAVRALTDEGDVTDLTGKIGSMVGDIVKQEADRELVRQKEIDNDKLMTGNLSPNSQANRDLSQEFFDSLEVDLGKFNLLSAEKQKALFPIIARTPPTGLVDALKDIESGVEVADARGYLDLFARLDQDTFSNGRARSRLGNTLAPAVMENLRDIHRIRITGGLNQSASEIATNLKNAQTTPAAKLNLEMVLGDQTLGQYTLEQTNGDRVVALELTPLVEYLARSGQSKTQIDARVAAIINEKYAPSEFIADPAFPLGTINMSRHALEAVLPDQDAVDKFTSIVESKLPDGYSLYANKTNAAAGAAVGYANLAQTQEQFDEAMKGSQDLKQVYLVPDPRTSGVGYFAYTVDDTNTLVPLIYDVTPLSRKGETPKPVRTFPFFDESILEDHYAQTKAAREADVKATLDRAEELVEKRREMKVQSQFKSFKDVTKAPSLWWEYFKMEREESALKGFGG